MAYDIFISYKLPHPTMDASKLLDKALDRKLVYDRLVIHSDQGWHYQHYSYQRKLQDHDIVQSLRLSWLQ